MSDLTITIVGNLTADPELRFTPSGAAVANFRIAHTPRTRGGNGEWKDGEPTFIDCTCWRQLAENVTESLTKGARVLAHGRLRTERWEQDGAQRSKLVLDVHHAGPELTFATAKPTKLRRGQPGGDEWASASRTRPAAADRSLTVVDGATEEPAF